MLGDHLLSAVHYNIKNYTHVEQWCSKNETSPLWMEFCKSVNDTNDCDYFHDSDLKVFPGIPGFASGVMHGKI